MDSYHIGQIVVALLFLLLGVSIVSKIYKDKQKGKLKSIGKKISAFIMLFIAFILIIFGGISNIVRVISETNKGNGSSQDLLLTTDEPTAQEIIDQCATQLEKDAGPSSGITLEDGINYCTCVNDAHTQQYGSAMKSLDLTNKGDSQAIAFKQATESRCLTKAGLTLN